MPEHARRPSRGSEKRGEQQHRRRLARAVGAEQPDQGPDRRLEIQRVEGSNAAVVAPEPFGDDRGGSRFALSSEA
jgi:hypothetical protein